MKEKEESKISPLQTPGIHDKREVGRSCCCSRKRKDDEIQTKTKPLQGVHRTPDDATGCLLQQSPSRKDERGCKEKSMK